MWCCSLLSLQPGFKWSWLHTQLCAQAPACQHWDMIMRNLSNSQTSGLEINDICDSRCDQRHKTPRLIYIPPQIKPPSWGNAEGAAQRVLLWSCLGPMPELWLGFNQGRFPARFRDGQIPTAGLAAGLGQGLSRWTHGWSLVLGNIWGVKSSLCKFQERLWCSQTAPKAGKGLKGTLCPQWCDV